VTDESFDAARGIDMPSLPDGAQDAFQAAVSRPTLLEAENGFSARCSMDFANSFQFGWIAVHFLGLTIACLVRIYAESRIESWLRAAFLLALAGVAVATLAGEQFGWPLWTLSAGTMAVMIVLAVADFRAPQHEPI
jgi:hypothetical protein